MAETHIQISWQEHCCTHHHKPSSEYLLIFPSNKFEWQAPRGSQHEGHVNVRAISQLLVKLSAQRPIFPTSPEHTTESGLPCLQDFQNSVRNSVTWRRLAAPPRGCDYTNFPLRTRMSFPKHPKFTIWTLVAYRVKINIPTRSTSVLHPVHYKLAQHNLMCIKRLHAGPTDPSR